MTSGEQKYLVRGTVGAVLLAALRSFDRRWVAGAAGAGAVGAGAGAGGAGGGNTRFPH